MLQQYEVIFKSPPVKKSTHTGKLYSLITSNGRYFAKFYQYHHDGYLRPEEVEISPTVYDALETAFEPLLAYSEGDIKLYTLS